MMSERHFKTLPQPGWVGKPLHEVKGLISGIEGLADTKDRRWILKNPDSAIAKFMVENIGAYWFLRNYKGGKSDRVPHIHSGGFPSVLTEDNHAPRAWRPWDHVVVREETETSRLSQRKTLTALASLLFRS